MKRNTFIILSILIGVGLKSFGQKLEKSKTDDPAKRTSWETFYTTMSANAYFRISSVGDTETFDLKYQDGTVFSIMKDDEIIFKLDNGELIKLPNLEYKITCTGCGAKGLIGSQAEGIQVSYPLNKDQIAKLKTNKIVNVRINTSTAPFANDIKDKNAAKVVASLMLL